MGVRPVPSVFDVCALNLSRCGAVFVAFLVCAAAGAADRNVYRYLDENGRVVYSEYPPAAGKDVKQVDSTPASTGRPSAKTGPRYDNPRREPTERSNPAFEKKRAPEKKPKSPKRDDGRPDG